MDKPAPKNKPPKNQHFHWLFLVALIGATIALFGQDQIIMGLKQNEKISLSSLLERYEAGEFKEIKVKNQKIIATTSDDQIFTTFKEPSANLGDLGIDTKAPKAELQIVDTTGSKTWTNLLIGLGPFLILILIIYFFAKRAGGLGGENGPFSFGKSRAKIYDKTKHQTKFTDVAGAEEAKEEVEELVDFLKNPQKYTRAGAKIPRGILLIGSPGTGKTLLARAIAGEADVPFFSVSGSEFIEMFVGVGASRVRDLFKAAKKNSPAIIFIDEIDAIGKQRGTGGHGGHDEREQTLNQILTEMDGFEPDSSVIILAATNRPDVLDKALLRPGRFDRRVHIDLPDMVAREKILKLHTRNKKLAKDVELIKVASKCVGFSGADLENVMNEAAIMSVKNKRRTIIQADMDDAIEKVSLGPARRSRKITDKEKAIVAYHEVGHALAGHFTENCEPVHKISIISRGRALGVTWFLPEEDTYLNSEQKMKDEMVSLHGGRVAERLIFGQTTTGASNDLKRITRIARSMVMTYGMGDQQRIGPVVFQEKTRGFAGNLSDDQGQHSDQTAQAIDDEVKRLVLEAESTCVKILKKNHQLLEQISQDILEKENLSREEFLAYL